MRLHRKLAPSSLLPQLALLLASTFSSTFFTFAQDTTCPPTNPEILGRACSLANNRLALDTNQFLSDCGYTAFCDPATNTCQPNGCRRDEYPFGYKRRCEWPPLCATGSFCPDESSGCLPVRSLGASCQLNRDDECASADGQDTVCLRNVCEAVNATAGARCISENVIYSIYTSYSQSYGEIISRDNCVSGFYCDGQSETCLSAKNVGDRCSANKECKSFNCVDSSLSVDIPLNNTPLGRCGTAPSIPNRPGLWVYIVITLAILLGALGLCCALIQIHARGRRRTRAEQRRYFEQQALLRDDVYEAYYRAAAAAANQSSGGGGGGGQHQQQQARANGMMHERAPHNHFHDGSGHYGSLSAMSQRSSAVPPSVHGAEPLTLRDEHEPGLHDEPVGYAR
ncbi:hypothetical protein V8E36_003785 [Tilletia maclaganii]